MTRIITLTLAASLALATPALAAQGDGTGGHGGTPNRGGDFGRGTPKAALTPAGQAAVLAAANALLAKIGGQPLNIGVVY